MTYVIKHVFPNGDEMWWRPRECGYTHELVAAGTYTQAEAERIEKIRPPQDTAIPLTVALRGLEPGTVGSLFGMRNYRGVP